MLIDAFMFYNELDILELRLTLLDEYVDQFVLVEAEVNHVGGEKPLYFKENSERFSKWLHKIRYVLVTKEVAPTDKNPWSREKFQREAILAGVQDAPGDALIMISDVDEIPDMAKVPFEKMPAGVISIHMYMFNYSFDYMFVDEHWVGTVITTLDLARKWSVNYFRDERWKFPVLPEAGWHLSSFGDEKMVLNKLKTFAHALDDNDHRHLQTEENIKEWIKEGKFVDGRTALLPRPIEVPLPGSVEVLRRLKMGTFP
ncbi:hypothetical protein AR679_gp027 [Yellowstone lake phycodnavirus 1]|uniref:hypothetical protein n=1 Tax=Yellowstone lake phycodnavirus 1 TaxID=1586713 RepID=UPI0006EBCB73|nr:hypothetical protein AR679_gp027 [Yellowstone lake phycodnavirus 1]BAT22053.1 hypothetical protein [Yellowstone lake phycodnavirus 1]